MKFCEFTVSTTSEASELVADILWQYTVYGVAICDYCDVIELIDNRRETFDYIDDKLSQATPTLVKAYVEIGDSERVACAIRNDLDNLQVAAKGNVICGTFEITRKIVEGDDWIEIWKKHFRPVKHGKIVVCPKWIDYNAKEGEKVLYIDSNMAFGTGEHETTSMCIKLLGEYIKEGDCLLDVGTGSGILGISGVMLGAKRAVMTDIDRVAVLSATHNAEINKVNDKCEIMLSDLIADVESIADIAVANITAEILARLTGDISRLLKKGGYLIMSGIIKSKLDFVLSTFSAVGFTTVKVICEGEWHAVVMQNA